MATFLQLAQKLRQESTGVAGTGPTAVTGQVGQLARLVTWIADAWEDVQNRHANWLWMRVPFTLNTVNADDTYAFGDCIDGLTAVAISRFSHWWLHDCSFPPRIYLQSSGVGTEGWLRYLPWDHFRRLYKIGAQNNGFPAHVTSDPQRNIVLGPKPNGIYVVSSDYQRGLQVLAADGDIPDMPTDYHKLIVYRAMEKYGAHSLASEIFARAQLEGGRFMKSLELNQLPAFQLAGPMA